jgi:hypothetical protein
MRHAISTTLTRFLSFGGNVKARKPAVLRRSPFSENDAIVSGGTGGEMLSTDSFAAIMEDKIDFTYSCTAIVSSHTVVSLVRIPSLCTISRANGSTTNAPGNDEEL